MDKIIQSKIDTYGFTEGIAPIEVDTTLWMVALFLRKQNLVPYTFLVDELSPEEIIEDSKAFYGKFFAVNNVYTPGQKSLAELYAQADKERICYNEDIKAFIENNFDNVSPFDLALKIAVPLL